MALNIKGTIDQDGGSSTWPLSTQRCNCRSACRRPFPACSTALRVWLLVVQAAATRSARIPPCVLYSRVPPGALPSSLHTRCLCLGSAHDHACLCACGCAGCGATMQLPAAKTAMRHAPRINAARPPFIPAAIYLHLSSHMTQ